MPWVGPAESSMLGALISVNTFTHDGWPVSISAVASSFARSMIIVLKLPAT